VKRIGIDVGGTNTDAVLLDGARLVAATKTPTTADVTAGVRQALAQLVAQAPAAAHAVQAVVIGTTHFVNAVVERKRLNRVAAVRLCLPASSAVLPFADWPAELREQVAGEVLLLPGGFEVDGREIAPFDEARARDAARRIADAGLTAVAVSGVFSPLRSTHEDRMAAILQEHCPGVRVTRSHELGRIGLLERENVALLNAALADLAARTVGAFREAIAASGLRAQLLLTQNDGTVMSADLAQAKPVLCFSSGPTNSMRGAAFLGGIRDAMVIDVGGTTSDIGVLVNGFPREANSHVEVGGVRTLFRMPDVLSLPLGGGTCVREAPLRLGPDSVGFRLLQEARVFGGATLTATDVAVAQGLIRLGDAARVAELPQALIDGFNAAARARLEAGIDSMKTRAGDVPVVAVGGGAFLIPARLEGVSEVVFVEHHDVANAVGAGMAQIGGEVDQVFAGLGRERAIDEAVQLARQRAVDAGAAPESIGIVEVEELPLAYMPGDTRRVRVRVSGELRAA
jgi:N-methylhydantoinase A/oxoprolinase/acetone carboxylase beta subunit